MACRLHGLPPVDRVLEPISSRASAKQAVAPPRRLSLGVWVPDPWRVTRWLAAVVVLLVIASTLGQILRLRFGYSYAAGLVPLFYVDDEGNVPTWYSSISLLAASALLLAIASTVRRHGDGAWRPWTILAVVFAGLSLDEVAQAHELLIAPLRGKLGGGGWLYYGWVVPGALFALVVAAAFARFLVRLPSSTRSLFLVAGLLFLAGALGVEVISAKLDFEYGPADPAYVAAVTIEETLEMSAIVVFLHALLAHLRALLDPSTPAG